MSEQIKETAYKVFDLSDKSIALYENSADKCASQLMSLEFEPKTDIVNAYRGILNTTLLLSFINLDLHAAFRQYLSTELSANYEKRQAMTKINIVMNEGYKKIYGFGDSRKLSYWVNQIKTTVDFLDGFDKEYKKIEEELEVFANNGILNQEKRNLAVHYDKDPMKVYKMLSELDADEVLKRCQDFYILLNRVAKFVAQLSCAMTSKVSCSSQ